MTDIEKQINKITKRINDNKNTQQSMPAELLQCVVFYSTSVIDFLDLNFNIFTNGIKNKIKDSVFVFPYYSKEIFTDQKSAELFLPHFLKRLVSEEKIPENVNELINENKIKTAIAPLVITFVERDEPKVIEKSDLEGIL